MLALACAFLLGVLITLNLSELPAAPWWALMFAPLITWLLRKRLLPGLSGRLDLAVSAVLVFAMGLFWSAWTASVLQGQWLAPDLENVPIEVTGTVVGLPSYSEGGVNFDFEVSNGVTPKRLRLGWYETEADIASGQQWQLSVRLRRPHGFANPGGFDYERWLFEKGVGATGSVVGQAQAQLIAQTSSLDTLRADISERLSALSPDGPAKALLPALTVGDRRGLSDPHWDVLRKTGTSHLVAISGLHVGLVAALGLLLGRLLAFLFPGLALRVTAPRLGAICGMLLALGYAALAGFSLPTVRALVMLTVALSAIALSRPVLPGRALGLALLAILIIDPLAPLNGGFWLSFGAVAGLLWVFAGRTRSGWLRGTLLAQWAVTLIMLPLVAGLFSQAVLLSPLVNLLAIPVTAILLVPLSLLSVLLLPFGDAAAAPLVSLLGFLLEHCWDGLVWIAELPGITIQMAPSPVWSVVLACVGGLLLLLPKGISVRWLGPVLALPLFFPPTQSIPEGDFRAQVLDVGQGLSVLVQTQNHNLLYDTGPRFRSGFDTGEAVIIPSLGALGVTTLERIVVSHADTDHAGGLAAVRGAYPEAEVITSARDELPGTQGCEIGQAWQWDGVEFAFLHPMPGQPYLGNNSSCVLRVSAAGGRLLLPGDISEVVERRLVREPEQIRSQVILAPHHGSATSSGAALVKAVSANYVVFSAGYHNRFGMPKPEVVARYAQNSEALEETSFFNTATAGAISFQFSADHPITAQAWRQRHRRIWQPPESPAAPLSGQ